MNLVEATASTLGSRILASAVEDAGFQVEVTQLRLRDLEHERRDLEAELSQVTADCHRVLNNFIRFVRRDIALLSFVEALHIAAVRTLSDVARRKGDIASRANKLAGFDVIASLRDLSADPSAEPRLEILDVPRMRQVLADSIAAKLERTPISVFVRLAKLLGSAELQHEVTQAHEKLQSAVRRVDPRWDSRLRDAGNLFLDGKLEVADAARLLALEPSDIAFEFERLGYVRSIDRIVLSDGERTAMLEQIQRVGASRDGSLVRRDVIASQRIEGIDARSHRVSTDDRDS